MIHSNLHLTHAPQNVHLRKETDSSFIYYCQHWERCYDPNQVWLQMLKVKIRSVIFKGLPPSFSDDHFCSKLVELVPQLFSFQEAIYIAQLFAVALGFHYFDFFLLFLLGASFGSWRFGITISQ